MYPHAGYQIPLSSSKDASRTCFNLWFHLPKDASCACYQIPLSSSKDASHAWFQSLVSPSQRCVICLLQSLVSPFQRCTSPSRASFILKLEPKNVRASSDLSCSQRCVARVSFSKGNIEGAPQNEVRRLVFGPFLADFDQNSP